MDIDNYAAQSLLTQSKLFADIYIKNKKLNHLQTKIDFVIKEKEPILTPAQIDLLFSAKCKDLRTKPTPDRIERFQQLCLSKCGNRKVVFTEMKLAFNFANQLANILRDNFEDRIAHINLSRNNLQDNGSLVLVNAIKHSYSIVSLNLMQNDISPFGMSKILQELSTSQSLCTLMLGANDA